MRFLFFLLITVFCSLPTRAAVATASPQPDHDIPSSTNPKRAAAEARLGRKLKLKERLLLSVARKKARRAARDGQRTSGLALGSFGAGLLSLLLFNSGMAYFGISLGIAAGSGVAALLLILLVPTAVVLGIKALRRLKKNPQQEGKGYAITGIVIGAVVALLMTAGFALLAAF